MNKETGVVGVDEVGRGALAGPVALGACIIRDREALRGVNLRDSKQLTASQRHSIFAEIHKAALRGKVSFAVSFITARSIDSRGIVQALRMAVARTLQKLDIKEDTSIILDGGLAAPPRFSKAQSYPKGDEKFQTIAAASIVAKVLRDKKMIRLSKKLPGYGFETHVGYGTQRHRMAIQTLGPTPEHRLTFCRNII